MNKTIRIKIVTPMNVIFDMEARMITMPGELGEFEVLPGHELLIANLKDGLTKITVGGSVFKYFIYSGLSEVTWTNVNIVTEFVVDTSSLQLHEIIRKIDSLTKEIDEEIDDTKIDIIKLDIARYESLLAHI